jgi:hypothetical protein
VLEVEGVKLPEVAEDIHGQTTQLVPLQIQTPQAQQPGEDFLWQRTQLILGQTDELWKRSKLKKKSGQSLTKGEHTLFIGVLKTL